MKALTIGEAADAVGGRFVGDGKTLHSAVAGVVKDDREAFEGCLFVCVKGQRADGHDFYGAARSRGAVCALAERAPAGGGDHILVESTLAALRALAAHYRRKFNMPIIGVTGSVGKTTAKEMIAAVLGTRYNVHKTPMNLNNEIGVPLTLLSMREEHTAAVIEMGISDCGEMGRLAEMARPTHCVMTSIGRCHLDTLGDLDGVLRAKSEIFEYMPRGSIAVVNGDDSHLRDLRLGPGIRKLTYGTGAGLDFRAENVATRGTRGITCDIVTGAEHFAAEIPAFGAHFVSAALAAAAVGSLLGATGAETARGLLEYRPVSGRADVMYTGKLTVIDDCYNANPDSVAASLRALCSLPGRRVAILGDMNELGPRSDALHRETGLLAAELGVDCLICCGERAEMIYKGFISSGRESEGYHFPFKDALLSRLPGLVKPGDCVLVKASHSHNFGVITAALML
jgi:UDP-N-acetylmuramoyl-tripeptide--D-alanyl-D-alanine ligase